MASKEEMSRVGKSNVRRGKTLERRVANLFSEWTGETFRRRRVEGRDSLTIERDSTADVISVSKESIFSIEVKNASGFSLEALLASPKTAKITTWWHQATYDASLMTKLLKKSIYPFLFFKPLPGYDWVMFPTELIDNKIITPKNGSPRNDIWFTAIRFDGYSLIGEVTHNVSQSKKHPILMPLILPSAYICRWNDLKDNVDSGSIFYAYRQDQEITE